MSLPTKIEKYNELTEHLRKAQEAAAMLAHLNNAEGDKLGQTLAHGWLGISELLRKMNYQVTQLAMGKGLLQ